MKISWKKILYTLVFAFLCLVDQRTKTTSGLDGLYETFRDLTGVALALVIFTQFKIEDIKKYKLPHIVWTIVWVLLSVPVFMWGKANRPFLNDWIVLMADFVLYGYILIHAGILCWINRKERRMNLCFGATFLAMMLIMICSRSEYIWPTAYLIMFGCLYLNFSFNGNKKDGDDFFQGILNGIILFYILAFGYCLVFRPYDSVRYVGVYCNPNINALLYLTALIAFFGKLLTLKVKENIDKLLMAFYFVGASSCLGLIFMTIGKTAWLMAAIFAFIFLLAYKFAQGKGFFIHGAGLILCSVVMFFLCFTLIRFVPPMFHHPVWFWGEWHEGKVHSWDKYDSEKFVNLDEFIEQALGRLANLADSVKGEKIEAPANVVNENNLSDAAWTEETKEEKADREAREKAALLTKEEGRNEILVRKTIYTYYFTHLTLFGRPYSEQGFQLTPAAWVGHAHNIYLQYGTDFGIIMLILFIVIIVWAVIYLTKRFRSTHDGRYIVYAMFILLPAVFGMLEYAWGVGSITITMLFVGFGKVICDEKSEENVGA